MSSGADATPDTRPQDAAFAARRQLLQMQMLYEVGLALSDSLDPAEVGDEVLHHAMAMVDARGGVLALLAGHSGGLEVVGQEGLAQQGATLLTWARAGVAPDRRGILQVEVQSGVGRHLCLVPLRFRADTLGLLLVVDKERRGGTVGPFTERDCDLLDAFALQAGAALHNARLHRELQSAFAELQAAQERIAHLEQLRALGDLAAELTHGMRHVLGLVVGQADTYLTLGGDAAAAMRGVLDAAEGGQSLIDRIQRVTRLGVGRERVLTDLNEVLGAAVRRAQALAGGAEAIGWKPLRAEPLPASYLNPQDLEEVFVNLIVNAVQAMPAGGTLTIAAEARGTELVATVVDTGTGMTPEVRSRIFEPFFSTRDGVGLGLGLAIVYRIVADHGGRVEVDTTPGAGSRFAVFLPISTSPPEPAADAPTHPGG